MKRLIVEVCVCPECVMMGAMDIIEAIVSLKKLKTQLRLNTQVQVITKSCIGDPKHGSDSPVVVINGDRLVCANSQTVMEKIISLKAKDVKH